MDMDMDINMDIGMDMDMDMDMDIDMDIGMDMATDMATDTNIDIQRVGCMILDFSNVRYHDEGFKELNACIRFLLHMVYL
jgi:hypothetical protein